MQRAKEQAEEWVAKIAEELEGFGPALGRSVARFGRNDIRHFALTRLLDLLSEEDRDVLNLQRLLGAWRSMDGESIPRRSNQNCHFGPLPCQTLNDPIHV